MPLNESNKITKASKTKDLPSPNLVNQVEMPDATLLDQIETDYSNLTHEALASIAQAQQAGILKGADRAKEVLGETPAMFRSVIASAAQPPVLEG